MLISFGRAILTAILVLPVLFQMQFVGAAFANDELLINCSLAETQEESNLNCDVRLVDLAPLESFNILANGERLANLSFMSFSDSGQSSAWLFLIDRSNPRRSVTVDRKVDLVQRYLRLADPERLVGVATFANDLTLVVAPGDTSAGRVDRVGQIEADGLATEFFATSLEAIRILSEVDADRRALVVMSDGKAEDTAFTRDDVAQAAREQGITIFGLGYAENAAETPSLQEIRRLADDTNGAFEAVIGQADFSEEFLNNLPRYLENGGTVSAPLADLSGEITFTVIANLSNGQSLQTQQTLFIEPDIVREPEPLSLIASIYSALDGVFPNASQWANTSQTMAWLLLLVLLGAVVGIAAFVLMTRKEQEPSLPPEEFEPTTQVIPTNPDDIPGQDEEAVDAGTRILETTTLEPTPYFGEFVLVGDQTQSFRLEQAAITIGRHSDNDFRLNNDSVHRHHAHVAILADDVVMITDLDTANGVVVNGERISKIELKDGDLIELGEVRFRYQFQQQ